MSSVSPTRADVSAMCRGPEPVEGRRRHERNDRNDTGDEAHTEHVSADRVELGEALRERCGQQERNQDLHTRKQDAELLQQSVIPPPELVAVPVVVEL